MKKYQHVITTTDGKAWFGEPAEGDYAARSSQIADLFSEEQVAGAITFALAGGDLLVLPATSILHVRTREAEASS